MRPEGPNHLKYRPDIDGLRAIAVVPVVLYHANIPGFSGGYVGVDVFFVISGYLITSILQKEIESGEFKITHFYERRIRRILPALLAVVLVSSIAGWFLLLPEQFSRFSESSVAVNLFASNFWFTFNTGRYFDSASEFEPLLQTWSLAVEEQFYVFFPLVLTFLNRFTANTRIRLILILSILSLALSCIGVGRYPTATFYLLPTRAWELGVGVLLSLGNCAPPQSKLLREGIAATSMASLGACIVIFDHNTPFPGIAALPVCLSTAALIWTGKSNAGPVNRLLRNRYLVSIGLVSYSWYLWHWPILSYVRIWNADTHIPIWEASVAVSASLLLAYFSWHFIELPFRRKNTIRLSPHKILAGGSVATICAVSAASIIIGSEGFPSRLPSEVTTLINSLRTGEEIRSACNFSLTNHHCSIGSKRNDSEFDFLVWGDSHADALLPAIDTAAKENGLTGTAMVKGGCLPVLGAEQINETPPVRERCEVFKRDVLAFLASHPEIKLVLISGRWALTSQGYDLPIEKAPKYSLALVNDDHTNNTTTFDVALEKTISALSSSGMRIVIVGNVPDIGWNVGDKLVRNAWWDSPLPPPPSRASSLDLSEPSESTIQRHAQSADNIYYVGLIDKICPNECLTHTGTIAYYRDDNHLTGAGAEHFSTPVFNLLFESLLPSQPEKATYADD